MENKSTLLRGTLGNGMVRYFAIDSTEMVKKIKDIHNTSFTATVALGRVVSAGAILGAMLKNDSDAMTITINGGGPAGSLVCTSYKSGLVKAYVDNPTIEIPPKEDGAINVAKFVGTNGRISIMRDMGFGQPYTGQCRLKTGEIASDLAYYFTKSEQIPSLTALGVSLNRDGSVYKAGGIILQVMPGCTDEMINNLEVRSMLMSDISKQLEVMSISDFVFAAFHDLDIKLSETTYPIYGCDCSIAKIQKVLISMGKSELIDMAKSQEETEIVCHFCQKEYKFSKDDIYNIIKIGT